jgi:hypothetical protein
MAWVKFGGMEFDVDSEEIDASSCGVTDADCVALAARIKAGEMRRLKNLDLVRLFSVLFSVLLDIPHLHLSSALFHRAAMKSASSARAPLRMRCAPTVVCRSWTLCVYVVAELCCTFVSFFLFSFVEFPPSPPLIRIISQNGNDIRADGARAIADAIRTNSSVQKLYLVRICCR